MRIRSAGLAALIVATGFWMGFSGAPVAAAKSTAKTASAAKSAKAGLASADRPIILSKFKKQKRAHMAKKSRTAQARHVKKSVSRATARKAAAADVPAKFSRSKLPPEVANARAEALAADEARNIAALDNTNVSNSNGVMVAANDPPKDADNTPMDNAVGTQDSAPPAPVAVDQSPPSPSGKIIRAVSSGEKPAVKADDSDTWSKTSLIGKIFIAFGGLLTLASAARLLIA